MRCGFSLFHGFSHNNHASTQVDPLPVRMATIVGRRSPLTGAYRLREGVPRWVAHLRAWHCCLDSFTRYV